MKTLYKFKLLSIFQFEKMALYLSEMHKQGYKLIFYFFPFFYIFQECTPEEVIYQIDYNEEAPKAKEEYIQIYKDAHWEYIQTIVNFSIFRKPAMQMDGVEHIFSDAQSSEEMQLRIKNSKTLPYVVLIALLVAALAIYTVFSNAFLLLGLLCIGPIIVIVRYKKAYMEKN